MSEEYFDILDENGNLTGKTKLRKDVHRDGDWHKSVHIWIINEKKEVLLQRRCPSKDSYPNMWDISCAGHLSAGDDSLGGALRELKEELDIDADADELHYIGTLKNSSECDAAFVNNEFADIYFLFTDKSIDDMRFQEEEISEIMFVAFDRFKEMADSCRKDLVMHDEEFKIVFKSIA